MSDNCWKINCTWLVKDVDELLIGSNLPKHSPTFKNENAEWRLETFCPNNPKRLFVKLELLNGYTIPSGKKVTFYITNPKFGGVSSSMSKIVPSESNSSFTVEWLYLEEMQNYVFDNTLKIVCKITEVQEETRTSAYESLMDNETLSDVKLLVGDMKFSAHKVVLYGQSPVFEKMFCHDMKESINNEMEITEMSAEIFQELLRYMYTGKVNNLDEKAQDILIAANRYQIEGLVLMCSNFLCTKMTEDNVAELVKLADDLNASTLKEYCINFIQRKCGLFPQSYSDIYRNLAETHEHLIAESEIELWNRLTRNMIHLGIPDMIREVEN